MHHLSLIAALCAISCAFGASVVRFEPADMPVTEVTVYESSGQIERSIHWKDAQPGEHLLQLRGLPAEMDESTFYIRASSLLTVIDTSVVVRTMTPDESPSEQLQELRTKHQSLLEKLAVNDQELKKLDQRIDLVKELGHSFIQTATKQDTKTLFTEFKELLKLSDDTLANSYSDRGKLELERSRLKKETDEVERQISAIVNDAASNRQVKDVTLRVRVPGSVKAPIAIQAVYHQHGCSWQPEYEIKVSSPPREDGSSSSSSSSSSSHGSMPVTLEYFARIRQSSYEDWDQVKLTLATNAPHRTAFPPTLYPQYVTTNPPYRAKAMAGMARTTTAGAAPEMAAFAMDTAFADEMLDVSYGAAEVSSTGLLGAYTFTLPEKVSVASFVLLGHGRSSAGVSTSKRIATSDNGVRVLVEKIQLSGRPFVWAVPSQTQAAFFQLLCKNSRMLPILGSGRANVYLDGTLVAQTQVPHTPVGEVFALNLGEDRGVKVTHRPLKITSNTEGIISKTRTRPFDTMTTITNQNTVPQVVIVGQAIPKTENSKIQVELLKPSVSELQPLAAKSTRSQQDELNNMLQDMSTKDVQDKPKVFNYVSKASNVLYWAVLLPPNETVNVPFEYRVIWPEAMGDVYVQNQYH